MFEADAQAVLAHRLDVRVDGLERGHAAIAEPGRAAPQVPARLVVDVERCEVERIQAAVVDTPEVTAERAAGELVLGPVVVAAPAAEQLRPAVAAQVVSRAEPRRDLVGEPELDPVFLDVGPE